MLAEIGAPSLDINPSISLSRGPSTTLSYEPPMSALVYSELYLAATIAKEPPVDCERFAIFFSMGCAAGVR